MNIALDTNTLIWAFRKTSSPDPAIKELEDRAKILFAMLDENDGLAIVPTVVVAEYLVGIDPEKHSSVISDFKKMFVMPSFDMHASFIAVEVWHKHKGFSKEDQVARSVLKADALVVATARAAGATRFYSHDRGCRNLAKAAGMDPHDLPTHHEDMFVDQQMRDGIREK